MIDLHVHSTFSDGSLTPAELVSKAVELELTAVALTDHDCTDGLPSFLGACEGTGVRGVPGVEMSADVDTGTMHMLAYYMDTENPELVSALEHVRDGRRIRNEKILNRLNEQGLSLTWEEVSDHAGEEVVGRPHFAMAMTKKGYVRTKQQAFDQYLAKGKVAYVDRFRLTAAESVRIVRNAGGVPVLAHPFTLQLDARQLHSCVGELAGLGLEGIEGYYSEYTPAQQEEYLELARDHGLVVVGGSDFHGDLNPAIKLGSGFGKLRIPDNLLGDLLARRDAVMKRP